LEEAVDSNAILLHKFELLQHVYSSIEAKQTILEELNTKYPECSRKSIERLLKQITYRDRKQDDERVVYYATDDCLN
jgi:hypothetical protein